MESNDDTKEFYLEITIESNLTLDEYYLLFTGILFGLPDLVVSSDMIRLPINNARILAKILFKLHRHLAEVQLSEYKWDSMNNTLRVELSLV